VAVSQPTTAFVWVWLPAETEPVVAGRLDDEGAITTFTYGRSYLGRGNAISLYEPELPLRPGPQAPQLMPMHGSIADAGPDAWGRRVVNRRRLGVTDADVDLTDLTYLLESGSNRIGALDFQPSPTEYQPGDDTAVPLADLLRAAEIVDQGLALPVGLDLALLHGTSVGGAQPKALLQDETNELIAKFASRTDVLPNVKLEHLTMRLARKVGLDVSSVEMATALGKEVLLVQRFDRPGGGARRMIVSARTMLHLGEMGIGASYSDLADLIRARFTEPERTLRELFGRISFNILVGNTDDHARNHSAFWDGSELTLTPAYDLVPQARHGETANQAMAIGPGGFRASQLAGCVTCAGTYMLSQTEARDIIDSQIATIETSWDAECDDAGLHEPERAQLWGRQILNPYALHGY